MTWTKVEICFYKPTGFEDTWVMNTDDRGLAVQAVIDSYKDQKHMGCVNTIHATLINKDYADQLVEQHRARVVGVNQSEK